ncbi:MAG: ABC transporter permease [Chloroflexi bacterium]|nr:ABC transporter permease [Chloroflexota bacterium]
MGRFVARRLLQAIPTMFGIMLVSFILLRVSPADPVKLMVPSDTEITEADKDRLRAAFGLDKPLPVQFIDFTVQAATLDFGKSFYYHRPARDMIFERIPNSIQPVVLGLLVGVFLGIPLGFIAALNRGRRTDHGIRVTSVVLNATPDFFLGLLFVLFLAIQFKWFPIGSMNVVGVDCTLCWDRAWHLVGPVIVERVFNWPGLGRLFFDSLIQKDYPIIQASLVMGAGLLLISYILRDITYALIDPRIKVR